MFTRIEAKNYRCLKEVSQPLNPFEILVGPNGSGKSTFLDVIGFLSDFAEGGITKALQSRTEDFIDLVSDRNGISFRLGVETEAPPDLRPQYESFQYEAAFGLDKSADRLVVWRQYADLIPGTAGEEKVSYRIDSEHYSFFPESVGAVTTLFGKLLRDEIKTVALNPSLLAKPSPAGSAGEKNITGAGLARIIWILKSQHPARFQDWLSHVRTALPEIRDINSVSRQWENSRYTMVRYSDDVEVPSWMLSEGTLRLLQLTILAYLPDFHGVYLIEEPENGVHPSALETIYQSLSSISEAQVLVSSHSPILLNMAEPEQLLCFSKSPDGVKIVRGSDHPALRDWQNEVSLGTLAASGILG